MFALKQDDDRNGERSLSCRAASWDIPQSNLIHHMRHSAPHEPCEPASIVIMIVIMIMIGFALTACLTRRRCGITACRASGQLPVSRTALRR